MVNEVLRLKNDVLNELRNQKYYAQDELKQRVDDTSMSQKDKVDKIIYLAGKMVDIENRIGLVDAIFVDNAPQPSMEQQPLNPIPEEQGDTRDDVPDNIVEGDNIVEADAPLNEKGQTHSE